jgi:hypothetical protein
MTAEKLETTENQINEADKEESPKTSSRATRSKEVVALSVKSKTETSSQSLSLVNQAGLLPGNRPIEPSHLKVVSTYNSLGGLRPITASEMEISSTIAISGNRPIALSHLNISETYSVMGNRPVASNEIEDISSLIGYLD